MRGFGAFGHLRYLVELAAVIGLVAAGQTFVVIAGGIDLSVAAIVTVSAVGLPLLSLASRSDRPRGDPRHVWCWPRHRPRQRARRGASARPSDDHDARHGDLPAGPAHPHRRRQLRISLENPLVAWLGNARPAGIPVGILLWLVVSAAVLIVLHATPFGARVFALGANPLAAALSGVPVNATTIAVYGISGFTSGLAGVLVLGMNGQGYVGIGDPYLLASIAAVVLGGTSILGGLGTYAGTIPGAILLVTITALITVVNASPGWRSILFGSLILGLLLLSGRESARR